MRFIFIFSKCFFLIPLLCFKLDLSKTELLEKIIFVDLIIIIKLKLILKQMKWNFVQVIPIKDLAEKNTLFSLLLYPNYRKKI
jgi:hypothetical protein